MGRLKIADIRMDNSLNARRRLNQEIIDDYADKFNQLPDIVVFDIDTEGLFVVDGWHRIAAGKKLGRDEIGAEIRKGTRKEAKEYALKANRKHGLPLTRLETTEAVKDMLRLYPERSDNWIAEDMGVSKNTVAKYREELEAACQIDRLNKLIGKDGKKYPREIKQAETKPSGQTEYPVQEETMVIPPSATSERTENIGAKATEERASPSDFNARSEPSAFDAEPVNQVEEFDFEEVIEEPTPPHPPVTGELDDETAVKHESPLKYVTLSEWSNNIQLINPPKSGTKFNRTNDNIEWARWTWNPVTGCLNICPYCYARDMAIRFYTQKFEPSIYPYRFSAPENTPCPNTDDIGEHNVFVCSMGDLFGKWVPREWITAVLDTCRDNPQWNFLFLTKSPQRLLKFTFPDNTWVGTTVDVQERVGQAQEVFAQLKANVKFLSCEPLREKLSFDSLEMFDWIIIGGQSETSREAAKQPEWEWVESLVWQARKAGCKIYFKPNLTTVPKEYPEGRPSNAK